MPRFEEYIAKGKLTPSDMGFTAFETAARRQQSFTADQVSSIDKTAKLAEQSAKGVAEAWTGGLKFGLDEIEMQQAKDKGGGGVKVENGGKVSRTLIGTGANSGVTHNEISRGARDLSQLARGLNGRVAPPVTAKDGITIDPDSGVAVARGNQGQQITQLATNPQGIPLGPGDINLRNLQQFGFDPSKQITVEPLSPIMTPEGEAAYKEGTVAGQLSDQDISPYNPDTNPFPKSGNGIWDNIKNSIWGDPNAGPNKNPVGKVGDVMAPSGFDKSGIPFYGTADSPKANSGGTITPIDQGTNTEPDLTQDPTVPDTNTPLPDTTSY